MKPTIDLNKVYGPELSPAGARLADKIANLYVKLAEELDAAGAGSGTWFINVYARRDGRILLEMVSHSGAAEAAKSTRVEINRSFGVNEGRRYLGNDMLKLGRGLQGTGAGIADLVNTTGAQALDLWGGSIVRLEANLDIGGYAWLRKGFWPAEGRDILDYIVKQSALPQVLKDRWASMSEVELRAYVLTPEFRQYKDAFLGQTWFGEADISNPRVREAFTGAIRRALPTAPAGATANELYRDAALRHQIGLRRYSSGLMARIANLLEKADAELTTLLRQRLPAFEGKPIDFTGERWKALLTDIRGARAEALRQYRELSRSELTTLSKMEGDREVALLNAAAPIEVSFAAVAADQLRAIVSSRPFQGKLLADWFKELEAADQRRLVSAVQLGMVQGEPVDDIVRRVVGTRANKYADGILAITRRDATAVVRTAVNHVSNTARGYVWEENDDIIGARIWSSTLDGRTTPVCRARDGHGTPVGDNELPPGVKPLTPANAHPPAHMNCRSVMIAYIDGVGLIGRRPTVVDTRTRNKREVDFRKLARQSGRSIREVRAEWARRAVGGVPATTTYQDFLSRQSASFQDEVLGRTRGRLFRQGGLQLDQFVDRTGNELTLAQLAETQPEAFIRAGLDPAGF